MSHERRPARRAEQCNFIGTCHACGKKAYLSRKIAKVKGRQFHPGQQLRFYQCRGSYYWHFTSMSAQSMAAWKDYRAS